MRKMVCRCFGIVIGAGIATVLGLKGMDLWMFTAETVNTGMAVLSALLASLAGVIIFAKRSKDSIKIREDIHKQVYYGKDR
ncbi:MAG: hypothetical protein ACOX8H_09170 [Ruminococcus sp.]|jgi:hypothetical protein